MAHLIAKIACSPQRPAMFYNEAAISSKIPEHCGVKAQRIPCKRLPDGERDLEVGETEHVESAEAEVDISASINA